MTARLPGLPRDQISGPWLFSTAEARTINSSSSYDGALSAPEPSAPPAIAPSTTAAEHREDTPPLYPSAARAKDCPPALREAFSGSTQDSTFPSVSSALNELSSRPLEMQ